VQVCGTRVAPTPYRLQFIAGERIRTRCAGLAGIENGDLVCPKAQAEAPI
jgi:hypothetical protein